MTTGFGGAYPYATGSGSVRIDTSEGGELHRDTSGVTAANQKRALAFLERRRRKGSTYLELLNSPGFPNGTGANNALTTLHIADYIVRLTAKRENCHVYVLAEHVAGREVKPYEPQGLKLHDEDAILRAEQLSLYLRDRAVFGDKPKPGDRELSRLLDYVAKRSRQSRNNK